LNVTILPIDFNNISLKNSYPLTEKLIEQEKGIATLVKLLQKENLSNLMLNKILGNNMIRSLHHDVLAKKLIGEGKNGTKKLTK
jgi:hypothetical protein